MVAQQGSGLPVEEGLKTLCPRLERVLFQIGLQRFVHPGLPALAGGLECLEYRDIKPDGFLYFGAAAQHPPPFDNNGMFPVFICLERIIRVFHGHTVGFIIRYSCNAIPVSGGFAPGPHGFT